MTLLYILLPLIAALTAAVWIVRNKRPDFEEDCLDDLPDCSGAGGGEWVDIMHIGV